MTNDINPIIPQTYIEKVKGVVSRNPENRFPASHAILRAITTFPGAPTASEYLALEISADSDVFDASHQTIKVRKDAVDAFVRHAAQQPSITEIKVRNTVVYTRPKPVKRGIREGALAEVLA